MRRERTVPGAWLVVGLLAAGLAWAAWQGLARPVPIGPQNPGASGGRLRGPDMRIDLNAATAAELEALPGIGPRLAERIAADRQARGPFASIDGLTRVRGVGPATVERIRPYVLAAGGPPAD